MKLSDFDFELPEELIATRPVSPRSAARMLVATPERMSDTHVYALPDLLRPGDRLILNDTRVLPVRLTGARRRATTDTAAGAGVAEVEVTLLAPRPDGDWTALVKPLKRLRDGDMIAFGAGLSGRMRGRTGDGQAILTLSCAGADLERALETVGAMPLPPYIAARRKADRRDRTDYQTIWARTPGAVAAPTASLHFDAPLLEALHARGIETTRVTLHVGAGTFLPVKVADPRTHRMHAEYGEIGPEAARDIAATRAEGGRIIPVGTTALRLIEAAAQDTGEVVPWAAPTDIFIYPGFSFRIADALMTNFHLPKSTLMMLVAAFMGTDRIHEIYGHAVSARYRFFSYGDSSLLLPGGA